MTTPPVHAPMLASRTTLPSDQLAPSKARGFVRSALTESLPSTPAAPEIPGELAHNAVLLVSELVTNAVMHAGTEIDIECRVEVNTPHTADCEQSACVVVEVADHHPSSVVGRRPDARRGLGLGLRLVSALATSWGVTYRPDRKTVWFRLEAAEEQSESGLPSHRTYQRYPHIVDRSRSSGWGNRMRVSFLAEASELLAGQLDEDMVAALTGQLLVPRLADWCGVWLRTDSGQRLSRVWHVDERRIAALRRALVHDPPPVRLRATAIPWPWPASVNSDTRGGSAMLFPLVAAGVPQGALLLGRAGPSSMPDSIVRMVEDVARLVAQAVVTARQYAQQTAISRALQRRQLPPALASIPGVETAIAYEPHAEAQTVGGDFYDIFPREDGLWCFLLGDVQGKDPEAMSITGLARHLVRLLARESQGVESVLHRLNAAMAEDSIETAEYGGQSTQPRFLSMLYGELQPDPASGGANCTIASAGHPLPLWLTINGTVQRVAEPQLLLGIDEKTTYSAASFHMAPGDTLLCVTDGVTERRNGDRLLDDDDGLSKILQECAGMNAPTVAEHIRQATHGFASEPLEDDLAILVLHTTEHPLLRTALPR
jgi:serine phosphatase RsbU (regulator of sigma subunit)/anti-sigma regulatory factor (Ser/Thr protein kinase)